VIEGFEEKGEGNAGEWKTARDRFHDLSDVEIATCDCFMEGISVAAETCQFGFGFLGRSELGEGRKRLTRDRCANFKIVSQNGVIRCWIRNGYLGSRISASDFDNSMSFILKSNDSEKTIDFTVGICGPNGKMVTSLVGESRACKGDLHVETIAFFRCENLSRFHDRSNVRIVRGVRSFGTSKMLFGWFADIDCGIFGRELGHFGDGEHRFVPDESA